MKFFTIDQNNSGGYHIQNEFVDQLVCIQSSNAKIAEDLLQNIVNDYSEYCECCGDRWYISLKDEDGYDYIHNSYGDNLETMSLNLVSPYASLVIVYYANGDKKRFNAKTKEFTDLGRWI